MHFNREQMTREKLKNIYEALGTDPVQGLSEQRAQELQHEKGLNKFDDEKKETIFQKIVHHLTDMTSLILLVAAGIALVLAIQSGHGYTDTIVIMAIIIINIVLAVRQEMGAEKALEALKSMNAHMTVAVRGGAKRAIDAVELVPGDILSLKAGDMIPADARLIESINLKVEESILTGESVPVEKDAEADISEKAPLGDQLNMLFSGCLITSGNAKAVVVETGMHTEMGKIAEMLNTTKKVKTPLQKRLAGLGKTLTYIALASAAVLFGLELYFGSRVLEILMNAVALGVAAVPETLPILATITLAYGVQKMAKKNAIIRKIPAVETLGSATVICSDKTGTLTMNRMSITKIWAVGHEPMAADDAFSKDETFLLEMMSLASNASVNNSGEEAVFLGDPTETAIVRLLQEKQITKETLDAECPKVFEIPFDSDRKCMTTAHKLEDGRFISITKGAFDRIPIDGMPNDLLEKAKHIHDSFAKNALRVIAAGYKYYDTLPTVLDAAELEQGLTFAGFVGMIDPPRPESMAAVQAAREAGIKTVMITGDHVVTASAIAQEIGILDERGKAITGMELANLSDEDLAANVKNYAVYARVSPEDKIRIVKAWQSHGEVVAMTGDGVNDAPALKAADVGVAMGSGTDVSKSASDVILADDNFATIIEAVAEGRRVYENIRKALFSLLSDNIAEIIAILFAVIRRWGMPLMPIQLLYINVVADGVPDMFFCREPAEDEAMQRPPISSKNSIFANGIGIRTAAGAICLAVITLIGFYIGNFIQLPGGIVPSLAVGQTMAFVINACSSVINSFNARSYKKSLFKIGLKSNRWLSYGIFGSMVLTVLVATLPGISTMFHSVPLSLYHWAWVVGLSVVPLVLGEIIKAAANTWKKFAK